MRAVTRRLGVVKKIRVGVTRAKLVSALCLAALLPLACGRPPDDRSTVTELTGSRFHYEIFHEQVEWQLGADEAIARQVAGWRTYYQDDDRWVEAVEWRAETTFDLAGPGLRLIELETLPRDFNRARPIRVYVNGSRIGEIESATQWQWTSILAPESKLLLGENHLSVEYLDENGDPMIGEEIEKHERSRFRRLRIRRPGQPAIAAADPTPPPNGMIRVGPNSAAVIARRFASGSVLRIDWRLLRRWIRPEIIIDRQGEDRRIIHPVSRWLGKMSGVETIRFDDEVVAVITLRSANPTASIDFRVVDFQPREQPVTDEPVETWRSRFNERDNVIIVVWDATRADSLGCYGHPGGFTPNADLLSRASQLYSNAFCSSPYTLASTATLMTGRYPEHHDVINVGDYLDQSIVTLAERLNLAGYQTTMVTSMPLASSFTGVHKGFDTLSEPFRVSMRDMDADRVRAAVLDILPDDQDKPLFLYAHFREPHSPLRPPEPYRSLYRRHPEQSDSLGSQEFLAQLIEVDDLTRGELETIQDLYHGNLRFADTEFGTFLTALKERGILDRAMLFLISDHAEALGERGLYGHNRNLFREMTHIPIIVHHTRNPESTIISALTGTVDIAPTVLDCIQDGGQWRSALAGQPLSLANHHRDDRVIHQVTYAVGHPLEGLRTPQWLMLRPWGNHTNRLFDIAANPAEQGNQARQHQVLVSYLRQRDRRELLRTDPGFQRAKKDAGRSRMDQEVEERLRYLGYVQ